MKLNLICLMLVSFCVSLSAHAAADMYGMFMVVKGDIKVINLKNETVAAKVGSKILPGETVSSGADARAKIVMSDRNVINVSPDSKLKIEKYENDAKTGQKNVEMNLIEGKVRNNVEQKYDGDKQKFIIKTPTAVAGVRGTQFLTSFNPQTRVTQVVTLMGAVHLASITNGVIGSGVMVKKGEMTSVNAGQAPAAPTSVPKEDLKKMDAESTTAQNGNRNSERTPASGGGTSASMTDKKDMDVSQAPPPPKDGGPKQPGPPPPPPPPDICRSNPQACRPPTNGPTKVIVKPIK